MNHVQLGQAGEKLACNHLLSKGHQLIHRNYRFGRTEIDIVSIDKTALVFTEVKTRNSGYFGSPLEAVTRAKQSQIIRTALAYVLQHNRTEEIRFDVIGIVKNQRQTSIEHIESAFYPILSW